MLPMEAKPMQHENANDLFVQNEVCQVLPDIPYS